MIWRARSTRSPAEMAINVRPLRTAPNSGRHVPQAHLRASECRCRERVSESKSFRLTIFTSSGEKAGVQQESDYCVRRRGRFEQTNSRFCHYFLTLKYQYSTEQVCGQESYASGRWHSDSASAVSTFSSLISPSQPSEKAHIQIGHRHQARIPRLDSLANHRTAA